jgi:hypothetical protein
MEAGLRLFPITPDFSHVAQSCSFYLMVRALLTIHSGQRDDND